jgi:hypothetical protein
MLWLVLLLSTLGVSVPTVPLIKPPPAAAWVAPPVGPRQIWHRHTALNAPDLTTFGTRQAWGVSCYQGRRLLGVVFQYGNRALVLKYQDPLP